MRKILFLIDSLSGGGAEKVLYTILQKIDKNRFNIYVASIVDTGFYSDLIKELPVHYLPIIKRPRSFWGKLYYRFKYKLIYNILPASLVYKLFIESNYDVEIAFVEGLCTKIIASNRNRKIKKIAWIHTDLEYNNWPLELSIYRNIEHERITYRSFDKIIAVSDSVLESTKRMFGVKSIQRIYNPLDESHILVQKNELGECKMSEEFTLVFVGRLVKQKGIDRLLKVIARLLNNKIKCKLIIVGAGEERENLESLAVRLGVIDSVNFVGFQSNPYKYMVGADLYVSSSRVEGFSLVVAEALLLGIPVVSTNCSGPNELLGNGKYGMLVENSAESLYQGIYKILTNKTLYNFYSQRAKERSCDFNSNDIITQIESLFE